MKCKWYAAFEGVCTNGECPYCSDVCPTSEHPEVCKYAGNRYEVSELVKILRCGAGDEYKCADCTANLKNKCDRKEAYRQAADMLEKLSKDVVPKDFHERCVELEIQKRIAAETEKKNGRLKVTSNLKNAAIF